MMSPTIPAVLQIPNGNSMSMVRVIKGAIETIEKYAPVTGECTDEENYRIIVVLDDLNEVLKRIA